MNRMAKVAIWIDKASAEKRWQYGENVFEYYLEEILAHAGIPFERMERPDELETKKPDILLVGLSGEDNARLDRITEFVRQGGTAISYAGLNRMAARLNCRTIRVKDAVYAELPGEKRLEAGGDLRALPADMWLPSERESAVEAKGTLRIGSPNGDEVAAASLEFPLGRGKLIRWNVNIPETVCKLQQGGGPVVEDGIPAPDGTGNLDEGILKADDKCELDWSLDRIRTESGMPFYALPYGDLWREALIAQLLREAGKLRLMLPFTDYWPAGVEQVAMISHDSDTNIDESAEITLELLKECGINSTWCMLEPGYSLPLYERIRDDGHELAFHYNALEADNGFWDQKEFERQLAYIRSTTGADIVSNKNHYTRFEGWGELFDWCEEAGIESDQTRGPSKMGNIGFLFGTCHPYYPIAWADQANRMYNVLEIGFLTQDLEHPALSDSSVIEPFLEQVRSVRGVAHFLFHQAHIMNLPQVREALRRVVDKARERGFVFWTGEQVLRWEQARRRALLNADDSGELTVKNAPRDLLVWAPLVEGQTDREADAFRFGIPCRSITVKTEAM